MWKIISKMENFWPSYSHFIYRREHTKLPTEKLRKKGVHGIEMHELVRDAVFQTISWKKAMSRRAVCGAGKNQDFMYRFSSQPSVYGSLVI